MGLRRVPGAGKGCPQPRPTDEARPPDRTARPAPPADARAPRSFPLPGGTNKTFSAKGDALSATLPGLQADTYYVFVVTAKNSVGSSAEPAVTFHAMPSAGQTAPGAPAGVSAAQATKDTVALQWQPPAGSPPDFYNIGCAGQCIRRA